MIPAMLEAHVQHFFFESADLINQVADILAGPVTEAAEAAVACLTAGGKLLVCAQRADVPLAQGLCAALMHGFERERPGLPALLLEGSRWLTAVAPEDELATQIRTLGQPGDLLVVFAGTVGDDVRLLAAVAEAHARDLSVILLTGGEPGHWPDALAETDVWIPVAHERPMRVRELHGLVMHALCDAIDLQLLGEAG
jgi:D-sedoheptulose 7-phosphate isomerase